MITIRKAGDLDARDMAELLDAIIRKGGSTAHTGQVTRATILEWMKRDPDMSAWHVAEDGDGRILGFQFFEPHPELPPEAAISQVSSSWDKPALALVQSFSTPRDRPRKTWGMPGSTPRSVPTIQADWRITKAVGLRPTPITRIKSWPMALSWTRSASGLIFVCSAVGKPLQSGLQEARSNKS